MGIHVLTDHNSHLSYIVKTENLGPLLLIWSDCDATIDKELHPLHASSMLHPLIIIIIWICLYSERF